LTKVPFTSENRSSWKIKCVTPREKETTIIINHTNDQKFCHTNVQQSKPNVLTIQTTIETNDYKIAFAIRITTIKQSEIH